MRLIDRLLKPSSEAREAVALLQSWELSQAAGPLNDFADYVRRAYYANGIVFALVAARSSILSEVEFAWLNRQTNKLFGTAALELVERPWPGGTTGDLVTRIEQDTSLAGNAYILRADRDLLQRLRPDWVKIIADSRTHRVAGYVYQPPGEVGQVLAVDEVAHIVGKPDPLHPWRGISWVQSVARQVIADGQMEEHKQKFFENAATPNLVVKLRDSLDPEGRKLLEQVVARRFEGSTNAWRTMIVDNGADVDVVGATMEQIAFVDVSAAGEARMCAAAETPPIIVGAIKGLEASTYSNYQQAFRRWIDVTIRPKWRQIAAKLGGLYTPDETPVGAVLSYDDRRVPALQQDEKDAAEIHDRQARTLGALVRAGYTPESAVAAVVNRDLTQLEHLGLLPTTLTDGTGMQPEDGDKTDPQQDT